MYKTHRVYIEKDMCLSDLILENPSLMLMMEFFNIDDAIGDQSVEAICAKHKIHLSTFLILANLYNGFRPRSNALNTDNVDIISIINFLKNTHVFYINEKYPQIKRCITKLYESQKREQIKQIEFFFNDYFDEVLEHLRYEDEVAFPYFSQLIAENNSAQNFSVNEYRTHHGDIETKLSDLKNLMIKHITLEGDFPLKRKFITRLFELENDLSIHSMIEDMILLPLVDEIEKKNYRE